MLVQAMIQCLLGPGLSFIPVQEGTPLVLLERHAFPLADTLAVDQIAVAVRGSARGYVLTWRERMLTELDFGGVSGPRRTVAALHDGLPGRHIAVSGAGELWVMSGFSSSCRVRRGSGEEMNCLLPLEFDRIAQAFFSGPNLVIVGRTQAHDAPVHVFGPDLSHLGSFGMLGEILAPEDSAMLNWGLGVAAPAPNGRILYAHLTPLRIGQFTADGELEVQIEAAEVMTPVRESVEDLSGVTVLLDTFPRTVGLASLGRDILHATYDPSKDRTTLRLYDERGRERASADLRFRLQILGRADDVLVALRMIDRPEIVLYTIGEEAARESE